ncbi:hypothetical protein GALMADRAFT_68181 [Galerina marginata CBS 339.88]|uniref:Uncharacterized protein n=1 Tax=Galerina marginata (strain CBS 339.88) TaxID=685588 RepID=A0A067T001_GALM3|nr:hypothetical protein GALMADRAFT_68181 [Galerina marginata CBS 339.88]
MTTSPPNPRRFGLAAYRQTLSAISKRTGAPLPSLVLSFGILHELTAVVPLVGCFYGARMMGVGERVVAAIVSDSDSDSDSGPESPSGAGAGAGQMKTWVEDGERWAVRVGRRYGVFGYERRGEGEVDDVEEMLASARAGGDGRGHIAGDVANAVFAYGATKALLPVRVAVSLWLSPAFSRSVVEPIRKGVVGVFRRKSS